MPKMTFQVSSEMDMILEELAAERDIPKSQVIRRAVLLMKYLDSDDKEISVVDKSSGKVSTLVFESQIGTGSGRRAN